MGCVSSKGISHDEQGEARRRKDSKKSLKRLVSSSKREEVSVAGADADPRVGIDGGTTRLIPKSQENAISAPPLLPDDREKAAVAVDWTCKGGRYRRQASLDVKADRVKPDLKTVGTGIDKDSNLAISTVPNGFEGEHVAAGWPSWLTNVAREAVRGWLPRRKDSFEKLDKIGQGTYSTVYRARDLETGKIVALKKVRFVNVDPESVRFMAREIYVLRRLDHPNIVKLEGLVSSRMSCSLSLVLEYMEHDLAGLAATPSIKFSESQVKCYMQQLLSGLDHCHSHGVLHRDIKGSNLLISNNGILKITDFGLATFFNPDQRQPLTSRVVTLWYRPPELLLGATDYGVSVDLWSTGCILAELFAGKPIMPGRTEVEQLHKIFKLCGSPSEEFWRKLKLPHATSFKLTQPYRRCVGEAFRNFPPSAVVLLDRLLAVEPADRGSAASALKSEFFTTKPLACDPSSLPKYPPCKEYDAKLRNEEARRQKAAAIKGHELESGRRKTMPMPDVNTELQKRRIRANPESGSNKYNPQEDGGSGFPIHPSRGTVENGFLHLSHSGVSRSTWNNKGYGDNAQTFSGHSLTNLGQSNGPDAPMQRSYMPHGGAADLSSFSGLVAARSSTTKLDNHREWAKDANWPEHRPSLKYNQLDVADASEKQEWMKHLLDRPSSSHKDGSAVSKESTAGYGTKKNRIHYSGPLMPPGGNIEEMLKEHERQIQQAVRRARLDKVKSKNYGVRGQSEALLYASRIGRRDR
ncbi:probable serine/threonine-protein kinase At1g54610 [Phoenix dactylifera]|uniref:[RNA-polymerase]-subunit kinase n=1 Tax=Phoenix dactylifera TaxID=42345 RepID=A0A8B9AWL5_PHODC|nr:probable serine/threonine-protein kinase At1g54610 [Phoenix dactylifera]